MPYTMQVLLTPLLPLFFGFVFYTLYREGKISRQGGIAALIALPVLLLLACLNSLAGIRAIDGFRKLTAADIHAIAFIDEARLNYACTARRGEPGPACVEREVRDPATLERLAATFAAAMPYAPNHEGARDRYLVRIDTAQGGRQWLVLGRGNRNNPETAWLEFNSHYDSGMHYGVYLDAPLYRELAGLELEKWRKKRPR